MALGNMAQSGGEIASSWGNVGKNLIRAKEEGEEARSAASKKRGYGMEKQGGN